jgi:sirohydrochlorin ferrochelatase
MVTALLLIAHGSRRPEANADLEALAAALRRRGPYALIQCCYLELAEPNIETGGDQCVAQGATRVLMVPYFLSAGTHVTEDLEAARRLLQTKHPRVAFRLCEPVGRHPLMVEIVAERARQADEERPAQAD